MSKLKVELTYDKKTNVTQTFIWNGMKLLEHKSIDGQLHNVQSNRDLILKNYEANKGEELKHDSKRIKK